MKALFTEEEFRKASCYQILQLECIQCHKIFNKTKKRIQDATRKNKNGACFCSNKCSHEFTKKPLKKGTYSGIHCKKCGKPGFYYGECSSGEFCSDFCARSYSSNLNKEQKIFNIKKSWGTENRPSKPKRVYIYKPKKVVPIEKRRFRNCQLSFCVECKSVIKNKNRLYCDICSPYSNFIKFYNKLQVTGINLEERNTKAINKFNHLYWDLEKSKIDLEKEYGLNTNSIYLFCKNNNIKLRTVGEGISMAFKNNKIKVVNPNDSCMYKQQFYTGHTGQIFYCRSSYEIKLAQKLDEFKEYYEYEGLSIEYLKRNKKAYYLPDFYFPQHNLILEPKSQYFFDTRNDIYKSQYDVVLKSGITIHYLFEKDIKGLNKHSNFINLIDSFQNRDYFK